MKHSREDESSNSFKMDVAKVFTDPSYQPITCIDMHTCGEPARIVIKGYPELSGTLLEQRAQAKAQHDHIRQRLMLEPRGHFDMYGAILRSETELTRSGEADIGVLFTTNDGYSMMCGHATIALGRFLVDTHDLGVFPARNTLKVDPQTSTIQLRLHAPCGLLDVRVPTSADGMKSDPTRPVSFKSIPCFATGLHIKVELQSEERWPELGNRSSVTADFAYGGAWYCFIPAAELGFPGGLKQFNYDAVDTATRRLKAAVNSRKDLVYLFKHSDVEDPSFLYSIIVIDRNLGEPLGESKGAETGLHFYSDQEVDRSPTGSGVSARLAVAYAKGELQEGESRTYHSLVSLHSDQASAFVGKVLHKDDAASTGQYAAVRTEVEGRAFYTGAHTFVVEDHDGLGNAGFIMKQFAAA